MKIDLELVSKIVIPFLTLIFGKYLEKWLSKQPKLVSYLGNVSAFALSNPERTQVFTHSIVVANQGKLACKNVRIGHQVLPDFQMYPSIKHSVEDTKGGRDIVLPILVPGEQVTIGYLYFPPLTWDKVNTYTKSDEGHARIIRVLPTQQMSPWVRRGLWALIIIGAVTVTYLLVEVVAWWLSR